MDEAVRQALMIDKTFTVADRRIGITTTGARSGKLRRQEVWLYRAGHHLYLTGTPGRRDWYANLLAHPQFVVHLQHKVVPVRRCRGKSSAFSTARGSSSSNVRQTCDN